MTGAYAVLTAAGSGSRFGSELPKALVEFRGRTLLSWALAGLADSGAVQAVCVTAPPQYLEAFTREIGRAGIPVQLVPGGPSRQASVYAGLAELESHFGPIAEPTPILVHDAARCFTPPALVTRLVETVAAGVPAVIPGLPVTDTIKQVGDGDAELAPVVATPARQTLRSIQTPQAFAWGVLWSAHQQGAALAQSEATAATDDASLVEMAGGQVWLCPGDVRATKITTPDDLWAAEGWLAPS